ncbi:hypothetical protein J2S78_002302 [Salibacterium salarium]|uniref:hypothetical protein n=1 Tax=Salibacterium salarium TaxID=284579 RepID=UPI00277E512E|nr:hypothetical protein [Salibacterium salarium]MDQ0299882.1 hypothetical protein [Salibacterium salarium]
MIEIFMDVGILEIFLVLSLLYITTWSVIGSSGPSWTCRYLINRNTHIDLRYNTNQIPDLDCLIFSMNRRKIPSVKDQQDDDDASLISPNI